MSGCEDCLLEPTVRARVVTVREWYRVLRKTAMDREAFPTNTAFRAAVEDARWDDVLWEVIARFRPRSERT